MPINSVFDSLSEVREAIEEGSVSGDVVEAKIEKNTISITLHDEDEYFAEYDDSDYFLSNGYENERQVLFRGSFDRIEEFCVELVKEFMGADITVNYRGKERSSDLI